MKKLLVISSLAGGGAEKLLVRLAQEWVRRGDDVKVLTLRSPRLDRYAVPDQVERVSLQADHLRWYYLGRYTKLIIRLRREITRARPGVVILIITKPNILVLLATVGTRIPVVATEQSAITTTELPRRERRLRRLAYRRAAGAVAPTRAARRLLQDMIPGVRMESIPNPLMVDGTPSGSVDADLRSYFPGTPKADLHFVVAAGRLHPVKGFDLLL